MVNPRDWFVEVDSPLERADVGSLSKQVFQQVCRTDFHAPGFSLLNLGKAVFPRDVRSFMVDLKRQLSACYLSQFQRRLSYLSMGRFDQQVTTKLHLDGAPDESILMLGYEPSAVKSRVFIADYSKCAHDLGISPREFLNDFNPMFTKGAELLRPYTTELECFDSNHFQVLLINNSSAALGAGMQGVMHQAQIVTPDASQRRVVNSTMIFASPSDQTEPISEAAQQTFVESDAISPRVY